MPALTCRRYQNAQTAGTSITVTSTSGRCPADVDQWEWSCGFYPGSHPGEHQYGTAETFDQSRTEFETAWAVFLSNRTEADFQAWRQSHGFRASTMRSK
jgi:hypothetical protein